MPAEHLKCLPLLLSRRTSPFFFPYLIPDWIPSFIFSDPTACWIRISYKISVMSSLCDSIIILKPFPEYKFIQYFKVQYMLAVIILYETWTSKQFPSYYDLSRKPWIRYAHAGKVRSSEDNRRMYTWTAADSEVEM